MKKIMLFKNIDKNLSKKFLKSYIVYIVVIIKTKTLYCGF